MKNGVVLSVEKVDYTKEGKDKTIIVNEVLCSDQTIESFTTKEETFKAGDKVFIVQVNGYNRGYAQATVTKEAIKEVKDFSAEWNKMWS